MSLRLRLALWYGALTGLVVLACGLIGYAIHARAHYDELDRMLVRDAEHLAVEHARGVGGEFAALLDVPVSADVVVRVYAADGTLLAANPGAPPGVSLDPRGVPPSAAVPAYDGLAGIAPRLVEVDPGKGGFAVIYVGDDRWRAYALPLQNDPTGRVLVLSAPLGRIDASVAGFRRLMLLVALSGTGTAFALGALLAGYALRPVATLTEAARTIAGRRAFDHRVASGPARDELGRLASTFNEMLASLEAAYQAQQRFVSDASHELRAPLTAIQANLDLLTRYPGMSEADRREAVAEASRETHRLGRLVADLLALARADAGVPIRRQRVELDRVLLDALAEARHLAHGQTLRAVSVRPAVVPGDPDRLKQLCLILLDNAIKYTPDGGHVGVSLERDASGAVVTVTDSGIGVPPADVGRVFDRFYRADPARSRDPGGTGLGLAIARWIVEQHGGEILLASSLGQGTTVRFVIPVQTGAPPKG